MTQGNSNGIVALAVVVAGLVVRVVFVLLRPSVASMGDAVFALGFVGLVVLILGFVISIMAMAAARPTGKCGDLSSLSEK